MEFCIIHLYQNNIITYNRETIVPVQIVQIVGLWQQQENIAKTLKVKGTKTAYLTAKHIVCKLAQENLHIIQLVIVAVALRTVFWITIQMLKFMSSQVFMRIQIYIYMRLDLKSSIYLSLIIKFKLYLFYPRKMQESWTNLCTRWGSYYRLLCGGCILQYWSKWLGILHSRGSYVSK